MPCQDARALIDAYRAKALSPLEALDETIAAIERWEPRVHAFAELCLDRARRAAREAERRLVRGHPVRPLEGVPFVAKDLLDSEGVVTRCGSRILAGRRPSADAEAVARMRRAGAVLVGKSATHEFGWGITTPGTHNPWDDARIAGGSSGGSAVAIAIGAVPLALGTDTAGSIRIPADFCGVIGLRPSRDFVPRTGVFPLAPSLDTVGPLAGTPDDAALALAVVSGRALVPVRDAAGHLSGVRLGVCTDVPADRERRDALARTTALARALGAELQEVHMPATADAYEALAPIVLAEGRFTHRTRGLWPARRDEYRTDVRARLTLAARMGPDEYLAAQVARARIAEELATAFEHVDLLLGLVSPLGPPAIDTDPDDPDFRRAVMGCTAPQSLAGLPACVLRAGFDETRVPIGIQITGPYGGDHAVLAAARELFAATPRVQSETPQ